MSLAARKCANRILCGFSQHEEHGGVVVPRLSSQRETDLEVCPVRHPTLKASGSS
jgi:hypothetical protein